MWLPWLRAIPREMLVRWDGLQTHNPTTQVQPEQSLSTANVNYDSDSTIAYGLEEVMNMGYESNSNHSDHIPASIDEVIRAITPVAWLDNPLPRPQHVVTDNYSPASPVYSPDHSPIQIDSDEEEVESRASMAPAPLEMPILTPANDIFESDNSDLDLDFEGETEGKNSEISQYWQHFPPDCMVYIYTPKAVMYITTHGLNIQMNPAHLTA